MKPAYREYPLAGFLLRQEPDGEEDEEEVNGGEKDDDGDEGDSD